MIVRFFQRYAFVVAFVLGSFAGRKLVPDSAPDWQELAVVMSVFIPVYLLLYKDGVTNNRPRRNKSQFR